jgi:hypothetical protein
MTDSTPRRPNRFAATVIGLALFEATTRAALLVIPGVSAQLPCGGDVTAACPLRDFLRSVHSNRHEIDDSHHPLYGHTVGGHEQGHTVNAQRIRRPDLVPPEAPEGMQRVILLGDSFTFGVDAEDHEIFPTRLGELRPDLDVVSLGVPAFGHDAAWLRYQEEGVPLHPDIVVMGHLWLLTVRDASQWYLAPKPWFTLQDDKLELHGVPIAPASERFSVLRRRPWSLMLAHAVLQLATGGNADPPLDWELTSAILDAFVADVRAHGAVPYVMSMPTTPAHAHGGLMADDQLAWLDWCATRPRLCIDTLPAFHDVWDQGRDTTRVGHWNAEGHEVVARALADTLPRAETPPSVDE